MPVGSAYASYDGLYSLFTRDRRTYFPVVLEVEIKTGKILRDHRNECDKWILKPEEEDQWQQQQQKKAA